MKILLAKLPLVLTRNVIGNIEKDCTTHIYSGLPALLIPHL
jgi:hypothetical protein